MALTRFVLPCLLTLGLAACAHDAREAGGREGKTLDREPLTPESLAALAEGAWVMRALPLTQAPDTSPCGVREPETCAEGWPRLPAWLHRAPPVSLSEEALDAALEALPSLVLAEDSGQYLLLGDWSTLPNHWLAAVLEVEVQARDDTGRERQVRWRREAGFGFERGQGLAEVDVSGVPPRGEALKGWRGGVRLSVSLPVRLRAIAFTRADVGREKDGVRLVSWEGPDVVLEGEALDGELVARAAEGGRLLPLTSRREGAARWDFLLSLARQRWESLPRRMRTPREARRVRWTTRLTGAPTSLEFHRVERRVTRALVLPLSRGESWPGARQSPQGNRIGVQAGGAGALPCAHVSEAWLRERVEAFATYWGRSAMPFIAVRLPACDNSASAELTYEDMRLLDARGQPLPASVVPVPEQGADGDCYCDRIALGQRTQPPGEAERAMKDLHRFEARLRLRYPRLRRVVLAPLAPDAPGPGFVSGPGWGEVTLRVPEAWREGVAWGRAGGPGRRHSLWGYDAEGRLVPHLRGEGAVEVFSAPPRRVELLVREGVVELERPLSLTWPERATP